MLAGGVAEIGIASHITGVICLFSLDHFSSCLLQNVEGISFEVVFLCGTQVGVTQILADSVQGSIFVESFGGPGASHVMSLYLLPLSAFEEFLESYSQAVCWIGLVLHVKYVISVCLFLPNLERLDYLDQAIAGVGEAAFLLLLGLDYNSADTVDFFNSCDVPEG